MKFSLDALKIPTRKKLIFYLGYASFEENNIYGSELALLNLAIEFSKFYDVTVFGKALTNIKIKGIPFLNTQSFDEFIKNNEIEVCIISRYINYLIEYPLVANKNYIWLHDVCYHPAYNGFMLPQDGKYLVENCLDKIKGIVTLTNWHKDLIKTKYDLPEYKMKIIGNGVNEAYFQDYQNFEELGKQPYRFIYTSDVCRGLEELVDYFEDIHTKYPSAELYVYRDDKSFENYPKLLEKIKETKYIYYGGKMNQKDLIKEFVKSDIWLYPTTFSETYCMSGLEALRAGCYCIATKLAALNETIGENGVLLDVDPKTPEGKQAFLLEVDKAFSNLEEKKKIQKQAFEWAKSQTWREISEKWLKMIE